MFGFLYHLVFNTTSILQGWTWVEMLHDVVTHGREMGRTDPGGGTDGNRRVRQASQNPHPGWPPRREPAPSRDRPDGAHDLGRNDLWRKALALGVPQTMLHGQPTDGWATHRPYAETGGIARGKNQRSRENTGNHPPSQ